MCRSDGGEELGHKNVRCERKGSCVFHYAAHKFNESSFPTFYLVFCRDFDTKAQQLKVVVAVTD